MERKSKEEEEFSATPNQELIFEKEDIQPRVSINPNNSSSLSRSVKNEEDQSISSENQNEIKEQLLSNLNPNLSFGQKRGMGIPEMVDINANQYLPPPPTGNVPVDESQVPLIIPPQNQDLESQQQIENEDDNESEYELCHHNDKKKILYITKPRIFLSLILLVFYLGGLVCLAIGLIFVAIIIAQESACADGGCDCCTGCKDSYCSMCDSGTALSICNFLNVLCYDIPIYGVPAYDVEYYKNRHHRMISYDVYEQNQQREPSFCQRLQNCLCCSCFDAFSFTKPRKSCILNKVEVYCTNCNSKLKVKSTGNDKVFPYLCVGTLGIGILVGGIMLYLHLRN